MHEFGRSDKNYQQLSKYWIDRSLALQFKEWLTASAVCEFK